MGIKIAVLKETRPGERRVTMVPAVAERLARLGAQFFKKAALFISGLSCLMVSLVFFTFALTHYLLAIAGTEIAALSVGGLYLAFALILLLLGRSGTKAAYHG